MREALLAFRNKLLSAGKPTGDVNELIIKGIVFWKDGQPQCKIKRSDFGFPWGE